MLGVPRLKMSMPVCTPVFATHNIVAPIALPMVLGLDGAAFEQAASGVIAGPSRIRSNRGHAVLKRISRRARGSCPRHRAVTLISRISRGSSSGRRHIEEGADARRAGRGANAGPLGPKLHRGRRRRGNRATGRGIMAGGPSNRANTPSVGKLSGGRPTHTRERALAGFLSDGSDLIRKASIGLERIRRSKCLPVCHTMILGKEGP